MNTGSRRSRNSSVIHTAIAAGLAAVLTLSMAGSAGAEPTPAAPQNPQRQLAALHVRMEQATEIYNEARVELTRSQARAAAVGKQIAVQHQKVKTLQTQVDDMAAAAYKGGNLNEFNSVFSADGPQTLLDQLSTLQNLSTSQRDQLDALAAAQRRLEAQRKTVTDELAIQSKREAILRAKKTAIESDLKKAKTLAAAAAAMAERASRAGQTSTRRSSASSSVSMPPIIGSGRGAVALRFAQSQMGKPYQWGGAGPDSYDCSGLTMRSWGAAGVSLPHSSRMQYGSSPRVSRSQLQPGDLVFFGSPISHVAIFYSGDTAIGAPTSGDVVRFQSISSMGYVGATRPG